MWYLLGAGASEEEPIVGLPWVAAVVNRVAAAAGAAETTAAAAEAAEATTTAAGAAEATAAVAGATMAAATRVMRGAVATAAVAGGAAAGGGEVLRTLGRKACPPRVFTMVGPEEERRWRGEFQSGNGDLK